MQVVIPAIPVCVLCLRVHCSDCDLRMIQLRDAIANLIPAASKEPKSTSFRIIGKIAFLSSETMKSSFMFLPGGFEFAPHPPSTSGLVCQGDNECSSESDSSFDPDDALLKYLDAMIADFVADWDYSLTRDDIYALSLLLFTSLYPIH